MRRKHRERTAVVAEVSDPEAIVGYDRLQRSREIVDESPGLKLLVELRDRPGRRYRRPWDALLCGLAEIAVV
jgi:hypothetical protein